MSWSESSDGSTLINDSSYDPSDPTQIRRIDYDSFQITIQIQVPISIQVSINDRAIHWQSQWLQSSQSYKS
jgi:hypothetical protein